MADETTEQHADTADKPLADLSAREAAIDQPAEPATNARARRRAYEDEIFGPNAVRISGEIERGSGSPYQKMTKEQRRKFDAHDRLVVAEDRMNEAAAALEKAQGDFEAAEAELAASEDAVHGSEQPE